MVTIRKEEKGAAKGHKRELVLKQVARNGGCLGMGQRTRKRGKSNKGNGSEQI